MFAEVLDTPLTLNYLKKCKENFIKTLVAVFEKVQNGVDIRGIFRTLFKSMIEQFCQNSNRLNILLSQKRFVIDV